MALNLNQKSRRMSVEISEHFVDNFTERWKLVTRDNLSPGDAVTVSSCPPVLLSSVLRGDSGGRGGDRSPLLGQAGADGRHLLIPADLNIQIRDKLFIH